MNADKLFNVASAIVGVAMVTTIVMHPNSAGVIKAIGDAFSNSIKFALGQGG